MGNNRIAFAPGKVYHVYTHGNADDNIFREEKNYYRFIDKYNQYLPVIAYTFAFCLMPNHFHVLLMVKNENELVTYYSKKYKQKSIEEIRKNLEQYNAQQFSNYLNAYAKYFNIKYNRRGSLFINNIGRRKIENRKYFLNAFHYIHSNPVMHKFVTDPGEYKFSSFNHYLKKNDVVIEKELANQLFPEINHDIMLNEKELGQYTLIMRIYY